MPSYRKVLSLAVFLFILAYFLNKVVSSVMKLNEEQIGTHVTEYISDYVLFPSVTACDLMGRLYANQSLAERVKQKRQLLQSVYYMENTSNQSVICHTFCGPYITK